MDNVQIKPASSLVVCFDKAVNGMLLQSTVHLSG